MGAIPFRQPLGSDTMPVVFMPAIPCIPFPGRALDPRSHTCAADGTPDESLFVIMTRSLTELANMYGTDKGTIGPSAECSAHNYTDIYEAYLERHRRSALTILEIGLGVTGERWNARIVRGRNTGGASIKMWYDYFPNSQIYGIDLNECSCLDSDRVRTFVADQGRVEDLDLFTEATGAIEFDVVVDDGSHRPDHQQVSFSYFFKKLKAGGLYFIEDLLSNGLGDGASGTMACDNVRNTRSVLKQYLLQGSFLEPNAIMDQAYLGTHIDSVSFHVPRVGVRHLFRSHLRRPIQKVVYYAPNTESLCAIRKK